MWKIIHIIVIDSGINKECLNQNVDIVLSRKYYQDKNGHVLYTTDFKVRNLHGTIVANTILDKCQNTKIIDFAILDENLETTGKIMVQSLKDAISLSPDIINLSLGTIKKRYLFQLYMIMKAAKENNIIVVASEANTNIFTLPANLSNVIGVHSIHNRLRRKRAHNSMVSSGIPTAFKKKEVKYNHSCSSNSYATAIITGFIASEMSRIEERKYGDG